MGWQKEIPDINGWYWVREKDYGEVYFYDMEEVRLIEGISSYYDWLDAPQWWSKIDAKEWSDCEWYGPLSPPD